MRRAPVATVLALLLTVIAGIVPAVAPRLLLPAGLGPAVALAADDISIATASRYTLVPKAERVRVVVDITAANEKPNRVTGGTVTRYFYDGVNLAIQPEARTVRATQDGRPLKVEVARRNGYRLVTILFRENLYYGETARVRLTFDLPGGEPRSESDIRVGSAFATFTAWAFGDRGSVRVEVPKAFRVEIVGADMERQKDSKGLQVWSATTARSLDWYAWVTATNDEALTRDRLTLAGGDEVVIRGWPEDKRWRSRVRELLRDGVPALVDRIGLAWPVDGSLVISEVHTPLLEGYAGFYDPETDEITISEDLDDLTIIHEASHAWFNKSLFTERWITEGLADEYAALVLRELDRGYPDPPASSPTEEAAFPLSDWPPPAAIRDEESLDRESYGYAASWALMRSIVTLVGEDAMRSRIRRRRRGHHGVSGRGATGAESSAQRLAAIPGSRAGRGRGRRRTGSPTRPRLPASWRSSRSTRPIGRILPARASARQALAELVEAGGEWAAPVVVRMAMDNWQFDAAKELMNRASDVLAVRDEIAGLAGVEGLEPPAKPEEDYQDAGSVAELTVVKEDADRSLAVLERVAGASDVVEAPRDWFTEVGLDGADPATELAAARTAWERADLDAAEGAAAAAVELIRTAPEAGRTRVLTVGAGAVLALLVLAAVAVFLARRRSSMARRSRAAAMASSGTGTPPDPSGPYATLPPEGPPAGPPGRPPSGDEGADPS